MLLLAALVTIVLGASAGAAAPARLTLAASIHHQPLTNLERKSPAAPRLVFGIYPGGAAGTVGPSGPVAPENPALRMAALEQLRPAGRPFVLHLYASYTGARGWSAAQQVGHDIEQYGRAGFQTELVLAYRPANGGLAEDVDGFVSFVRDAVRSLGLLPGLVSLQVTNEPNLSFMDGAKPYVLDALVHGVVAAKDEAGRRGLPIDVGFGSVPQSPVALPGFWAGLAAAASPEFAGSVDFVGHNFYVDVFEDPVELAEIPGRVEEILRSLRTEHLAAAGIPALVQIRVTENGWPTGT